MLLKRHTEDVSKYSFVDECKIRGGKFCITYLNAEGNVRVKKLELRSSIDKLQRTIKEIRMDTMVTPYGKGKHGSTYIV